MVVGRRRRQQALYLAALDERREQREALELRHYLEVLTTRLEAMRDAEHVVLSERPTADDLGDECRGWLLVSRKARADMQDRIEAGERLDLKEAQQALAMAERANKPSELIRGRVTSRSERVRAGEPSPTAEEEAEMARLAALAQESEKGKLQ